MQTPMHSTDRTLLRLYEQDELLESHVLSIWFVADACGVVRPWLHDDGLLETLLLLACRKSHTYLMELLLRPSLFHGCSAATTETIIDAARTQRLFGALRFFVQHDIGDMNEMMYWTCKQSPLDDDTEVRYLFDSLMQKASVDKAFESNLFIGTAAKYNNLYAVQALLACPEVEVDPSDERNYALCTASKYGHVEVVERLLQDRRVDPSDDDNRAIRLACQYNHLPVVQRLMRSHRVDPSCRSNVCVQYAIDHAIDDWSNHLLLKALLTDPRVSLTNAQAMALL